MMEEDGDDFGPLYSDIVKPCSSVKQPHIFNDQNPSNFHTSSDLSANVYKDLKEYDGFLLSECGVDGDFDDVIFDVEMEQKEVEFDRLDEDNEINVLGDMMDEENDDLELDNARDLTNNDICVNEEDSEHDESVDIIVEDSDLNDHNVGSDKKDFEKKELGLLRNSDDPDDLDDLEPGEIAGTRTELGIGVDARVGHSYQSFHTGIKGVRSVFMSQTIDADSKAEQNQVNPVRSAEYNYGCCNRLRYLPAYFKKAFNIGDDYSGYKPWKRPGVNLSDFFNFDMDEENWQNYCKQMKQLLQTSPPSKDVGYESEQLQSKNTLGKQFGEAIQVLISHGERVACLENHHWRECDSDEIIEIVFVDSPYDTVSFTKDLKDRALHDYKKRPTTGHKIINGDKILPFPLDGSFHQIFHEKRTSHRVSINYAQEGRQGTDFESMASKMKNHISHQDWSMDLDHPMDKSESEAEQGLHGELVKYDKVMPLYSNKGVKKNNEGQTTVRHRLEDDGFYNNGEKSWRQGDSNYKKSLKQPDESKPTANVYDSQEITGNGVDNGRMRREETLSQTDHQEGNNDNKLNKGSAVDEDNCKMKIEETLSQTDHQEGNNDNKLNQGSAVDEDVSDKQVTDLIDNHEKEFPNDCNLAKNLGNDVIFDDQKHEAKREESKKMQGSPKARESYKDEMKQLMSNIKGFMSEVDELVYSHKHEHRICCLR